jgi:hypothetical protein
MSLIDAIVKGVLNLQVDIERYRKRRWRLGLQTDLGTHNGSTNYSNF